MAGASIFLGIDVFRSNNNNACCIFMMLLLLITTRIICFLMEHIPSPNKLKVLWFVNSAHRGRGENSKKCKHCFYATRNKIG